MLNSDFVDTGAKQGESPTSLLGSIENKERVDSHADNKNEFGSEDLETLAPLRIRSNKKSYGIV